MRVRCLVDPADLRRWHAEAVAAMAAHADVELVATSGGAAAGPLDLCLWFERLTARRPAGGPLERIDPVGLVRPETGAPADLVIDLTATSGQGGDQLAIGVGGVDLLRGAASAIMAGLPPTVELVAVSGAARRCVGRWTVGVEHRHLLTPGLETVAVRAVEMLALAVRRLALGTPLAGLTLSDAGASPAAATGHPRLFVASAFARRLAGRLDRMLRTPPNWAVAFRPDETGDDALPLIAGRRWHRLADDGRRFLADPFLWQRDGRTHLFVEEFPFATGKGVISVVEMGADGPLGTPRPVIETGCHLSYPFVFEDEGSVYMIPETSGRRTVELWRAVDYPDRWEVEAVLIEDVCLADATLHRLGDRYLMLATRQPRHGSSWDGLDIYVADRLTGPWRPLHDGPAKVDVSSARPAGRLFSAGGALIRPFQDSAGGYGAGLGFARIDHCDEGGFAETVLGRIRPRPPLSGLHTYNRGGGFEVIDIFAPAGDEPVTP